MRLSEAITIYLAAGAPFGVSYYLHEQRKASGFRAFVRAAAAALLWPLGATAILKSGWRHSDREAEGCDEQARAGERLEEATRRFVGSVQAALEQTARASCAGGLKKEELERALHILRESLEQYAGLAASSLEEYEDAAPAKHELELNRLAGRRGDDLKVAGLCVHRRNMSRIIARRRRARARSLAALAELGVEADALFARREGAQDALRRQQLSECLLEIFGRAVELFSLLDDTGAATTTARFLDAERSRYSELEESKRDGARARAAGEERCTDNAPQLIFTDRQRETTFTQG